ncbi:MAG: MgtC/SapB family protein, partial [Planctomycetota bacterium]
VLGGLVGLERELRGRSAGLRTNLMVCLGATMVMLTASAFPSPGRLAQGALTGIGFIGAGAILRLKGRIHGLTTAGCIWFMAALGVVLGIGAYAEAVAGTLLVLLVLHGLWVIEQRLSPDTYRELVVQADRRAVSIADAREVVQGAGYLVQTYETKEDVARDELTVSFHVRFRPHEVSDDMLFRRLRELPGLRSFAWHQLTR